MRVALMLILCVASASSQAVWLNRTPLRSPSPRSSPALAYDAVRQRVVLFGGQYFSIPRFNDTWTWDGFLWTQMQPAVRPGVGSWAMVYDSSRSVAVAFGGTQETWEWDGALWTLRQPPSRPPIRWDHAMAFDTTRGRVVLFGGSGNQGLLADTWEFDGTTWQQRTPTTAPTPRRWHSMTYDSARGLTVLVSGHDGNNPSPDTWVWDGSNWNRRTDAGYYPRAALAYDSSRRRTVLLAPVNNFDTTTLDWDGNSWSSVSTASSPPAIAGMVYDPLRGHTVVFGGLGLRGLSSDTWILAHDCSVVGAGHAGGGLPASCLTSPVLGQRFCFAYSSPLQFGFLGLGPAPCDSPTRLDPPIFCASGLLYPTLAVVIPGRGNPVITCFEIPFDPVLAGVRICLQGAGHNLPSCFLLTDGILVSIRFP